MAKKVFVSYDHSEDAHYRDLLRAWDANTEFDFEIEMRSPTVAIDSTEASRVQAALTTKMKQSEYILVIIGEKSNNSKWMNWEIDRAKQSDVNLKFAAVKIKQDNVKPVNLPSYTAIADEFKRGKIEAALRNAKKS
jgi:hypothetical protein